MGQIIMGYVIAVKLFAKDAEDVGISFKAVSVFETEGGFSEPPLPFDWRTGMSTLLGKGGRVFQPACGFNWRTGMCALRL